MSVFRYLDAAGDGSGNKNFNGNYSVTAEEAYIEPAAGEKFEIHRMLIAVEDTSGMQAEEYGNLGAALSNGIEVRVEEKVSGEVIDLTDNVPILTNADWGRVCYDVDLKSWGAGNELLLVRWTFSVSGKPLLLNGDDDQRLVVAMNDDLSGLIQHRFMVQGLRL